MNHGSKNGKTSIKTPSLQPPGAAACRAQGEGHQYHQRLESRGGGAMGPPLDGRGPRCLKKVAELWLIYGLSMV